MCPVQNLMQFPDRARWYEAKFAADDMPDWNGGRFVSINQEAPGMKMAVTASQPILFVWFSRGAPPIGLGPQVKSRT